jgi:cytoskeletal protein CcmA (bactofilin family)
MAQVENKSVPSIISSGLSIQGNLSSDGEIQIDGMVTGDISCKVLIIGSDGSVAGQVMAQNVRVHGMLTGTIKAKSVFLVSTAKMYGDIEHESLAIEPGAFMEGHCKRSVPNKNLPEKNKTGQVSPGRVENLQNGKTSNHATPS